MTSCDRIVIPGKQCLIPEIRQIGWSRFRSARPRGLTGHVHRDHVELCCIVRGTVHWVNDGVEHLVHGGQLFLTPPGEIHGGIDAMMGRCELFWLQISLGSPRMDHLLGSEAKAVRKAILTSKERVFNIPNTWMNLFPQIFAEARDRKQYRKACFYMLLGKLLIEVARLIDQRGNQTLPAPSLSRALRMIQKDPTLPMSVKDLAAWAGCSRSYFAKTFLKDIGCTPMEFVLAKRVDLAKTMLAKPEQSMTDIAFGCGFSSSQYFATAFRRLTGMTPSAYRMQTAPRAT